MARLAGLCLGLALLPAALAAHSQAPASVMIATWPTDREPPTLAEIASGLADPGFVEQAVPDRRIGPDPRRMRWWRVSTTRPWKRDSHPVLALYAPYFNTVQVLAPPDYGARRLSLRAPDFDTSHSRHALVLDLPAAWDSSQPVYLGIEPGTRLPMRVQVVSRVEFEAGDVRHLQLVWSLLAGLGMVMVIVAVFGVVLRARELLYLAGSIAAMLLFQGLVLGESYDLPGGRWLAGTGFRVIWCARALQEAFLILFAIEFLQCGRYLPRFRQGLGLVAIGFFVIAVLSWLPLPAAAAPVLGSIGSSLLALGVVLLLAAIILRVRQGSVEARYFVVAWLPLLVLDVLRELELLRVVALYPGNEYLPLYASAWASFLLAIGVAKRMLAVLRERDVAVVAAELDPLTGVLNHRAILERLQRESNDAGAGVCVLYLDLDRFKLVNDRFGHAVGDACLAAAVGAIRSGLRAGDSLGRLGGEEFLAVLPSTNEGQAMRIAERIRAGVEGVGNSIEGCEVGLTISVGVASTETTPAWADLVDRADRAMYVAKEEGRNCVRAARPTAVAERNP